MDDEYGMLLLAQAAMGNSVSRVQPKKYVVSSPLAYPSFTDYIRSSEFKKAKAAVLSYLALSPSCKLTESNLKSCTEAIPKLLCNPAISSQAYDKLCIIRDYFPALVTKFHEAQHTKDTAKFIMVYLKCVNDGITIDLEAYKKMEAKMKSESEPGKKVSSMYPTYEVASSRFKKARRDISEMLIVVEDLSSDIRL